MWGKLLIVIGLVLVAIGLSALYAPWLISWFGRLPGDINFTRGSTRIFIPITSMIVLSIAVTIAVNLFFRR